MDRSYRLSDYVRGFFTDRLLGESQATPNTVATYRDTFRLLIRFASERKGIVQNELRIADIDADLIERFLEFCVEKRRNSARSLSTRLSAIRSFFRYVNDGSEPWLQKQCSEVLGIASQRFERRAANYLNCEELRALIDAPDCSSWLGRRDRTLLLMIQQIGLRASVLTRLRRRDVELGTGAHVRWTGKGGKPEIRLLSRDSRQALQDWLSERKADPDEPVFTNPRGKPLSHDALERLIRKHADRASQRCPTLAKKRVTPSIVSRSALFLMDGTKSPLLAFHEPTESTGDCGHPYIESKRGAISIQNTVEGRHERQLSDEGSLEFLAAL